MSYKKIVFWSVLTFSTPHISLAQVINDGISKNLYIGAQYKPARHYLSNLIIKETSSDIVATFALKKDPAPAPPASNNNPIDIIKHNANFTVNYNPHYKNNNAGFSGILGYYYNNNFRMESEISYETFHLRNEGYKVAGLEKHFALAQEIDTRSYQPQANKYVTIINNGIGITSVLINACYDSVSINNIVTYSCIGVGVDIVDFLSKYTTKLSYQGKSGISYSISSRIMLFGEGYYHGLLGKQFSNIPVNYPCDYTTTSSVDTAPTVTHPKEKTTALAILKVGYYGGSIGVRFIL